MQIPQILQQLQGNQASQAMQLLMPQINNAKQVMRMINSANNPQMALQQMMQSNPKYAEAMNIINGFNGDINSAITSLCKQKGIDPNEFMNALK